MLMGPQFLKCKSGTSYRYAVHVPANLPLDAAAPLLCAGITVYSPMMHYGLNKPGMKLGVVGLGGLGHMAVKFGKVRSEYSAALVIPVMVNTSTSQKSGQG